ncbi:MAG TPA: hypothetical protein VIA06_01240 [Candidatus Dormibacteraeota bacterium]|jgi:hypothetical protein|nr:hypothetical protein [Candidatus Dormibacteraeota bacterium]
MTDDERKPVIDPKVVRTWERLLRLGRGSADLLEILLPVAAGLTRDELARTLTRATGLREGSPVDALEQIWRLLGVVPRYRHEELLRRYEVLRQRVEEAEAGLRQVRRTMDQQDRQVEAQEALDSWGALLRRTLTAQADLVRSVTGIDVPAPLGLGPQAPEAAAPEPAVEEPAAEGPEAPPAKPRKKSSRPRKQAG